MSCKTMITCLKCSATVILLLLLQSSVYSQYDFSKLDEVIKQNQPAFKNNLVTMIYKDGKIIYLKETNKEDFKKDAPELVNAGSAWFTAALVMTFVDEGKLSLDDKVSDYIPIMEKYSKTYITIRDCLAQTTGIENDTKRLQKMVQKNKFASLEEQVDYFAAKNDIVNNPGKDFYYGSVGMNLAGRVLEVIAKRKTFDQLMKDRIFKPLLMKRSSFTVDAGAVNPATGATSSAADYINFMTMLLNKGMFNGKKVLSEESVAEMEKIRTTNAGMIKFQPLQTTGFNYVFGAWSQEDDGKGNATVLTSPSFTGTVPIIDKCRGYVCVFFTKNLKEEPSRDIYAALKQAIDEQIKAMCN